MTNLKSAQALQQYIEVQQKMFDRKIRNCQRTVEESQMLMELLCEWFGKFEWTHDELNNLNNLIESSPLTTREFLEANDG